MKLYSIIPILLLLTMMASNSKTSKSDPTNETSFSKEKEVVQYLIPKQKSIHLFNLPEGVSEKQIIASLSEINSVISDLGYSNVGYQLYKVESDTIQKYRYFMEGLWPDPETYRIIHEDEKWKQAAEKNTEMWDKVFAEEIYRRVLKVDTGE